jgi:hypothetical protein
MANSLAIVRESDGRVVTFVRNDVPDGWTPPEGTRVVPDNELPAGWQMAEDTSPVPPSVTARQIRLWLVRSGYSLDTITQAISAIPDAATRDAVAVEWEYAPYVERSHPWLAPLGQALGLDDANIDQAFRQAASL